MDRLVAPPYDVISADQRADLAAKSPHNVVHLTLPEQHADDRSKFVKYARSSSRLQEWKTAGLLQPEDPPAFYRYRQTFRIPGVMAPQQRLSLIGLIRLEPYENGVVLPHEQTFPKHKEDRLRILEATRSHLECIFGLYEDDDHSALASIQNAPGRPVADVTDEDGVHHQLELVDDPGAVSAIQAALSARKVWIADGHHRYETALTHRANLGARDGEVPEDYMMMALTSMADPGLALLPTHRILKQLPLSRAEFKVALADQFDVDEVPNAGLMHALEGHPEPGAFAVAFPGGQGWLIRAKDPARLQNALPEAGSPALKGLDVSVLHGYLFERVLGLKGLDFFSYTRDPHEALQAVEEGAPAAFLMNPPTVQDMRVIALGGEKMPQKSTYYYPKILSGLVLWSLDDFA